MGNDQIKSPVFCDSMRYFDNFYIELYTSKNYKKLIIWKFMRLDDSNKISLDYIFSYTLVTIYKISLNNK